jgi:hypothetical protein
LNALPKTTLQAWFFYGVKTFLLLLVFGLGALPAQIPLPDLPVDEERKTPEIKKVDSETSEVEKLIEEIKGAGHRSRFIEKPSGEAEERLKVSTEQYSERRKSFVVELNLRSGEKLWGEIENQSMKVVNDVGEFPLVFNQIRQAVAGDESTFIFQLRGGDTLTGKPSLDILGVTLADGGRRILSFRDIVQIKLMEEE